MESSGKLVEILKLARNYYTKKQLIIEKEIYATVTKDICKWHLFLYLFQVKHFHGKLILLLEHTHVYVCTCVTLANSVIKTKIGFRLEKRLHLNA